MYCKVLNNSRSEAVVLAIDNALVHDRRIADGAVFNIHDFHIVEFKTNAEGKSVEAVKSTYLGAMEQLQSTINWFDELSRKEKGHAFTETINNLECNMVVTLSFLRNNAAEMSYAIAFAKATGGIPLSFDNEIKLE